MTGAGHWKDTIFIVTIIHGAISLAHRLELSFELLYHTLYIAYKRKEISDWLK